MKKRIQLELCLLEYLRKIWAGKEFKKVNIWVYHMVNFPTYLYTHKRDNCSLTHFSLFEPYFDSPASEFW